MKCILANIFLDVNGQPRAERKACSELAEPYCSMLVSELPIYVLYDWDHPRNKPLLALLIVEDEKTVGQALAERDATVILATDNRILVRLKELP